MSSTGYPDARPYRNLPAGPNWSRCVCEANEARTMVIVAVFMLLALFSIISIVASAEEPRDYGTPQDNPVLWAMLGRR